MAAKKRPMSTKAKVITALIYLLALALIAAVVYTMVRPVSEEKPTAKPTTTVVSEDTTVELPYNAEASDKYANVESDYKLADISLDKDGHDVLSAFVDGKKVTDYTGVVKKDKTWYFVRDGEVDLHYNGIAANENGNWYIKNGKVDFSYTGTYEVNGNSYDIKGGKVVK